MSHSKSYSDTYPGKVVSVTDPQKRGRVKVHVYDIFDNVPVNDLPWATFCLPLGSRKGEGLVTPVQVGDEVWVRFNNGSTRYPMIVGANHATPDGIANLPPEALQGSGGYAHKRTDKQPAVEEAPYYEDVVYKQNNALIQITRAGNIRITQMASGSAIELLPSGDIVIHGEGNCFISVKGNTEEEYDGNLKQTIKGNFVQEVAGSISQVSTGPANFGSQSSDLTLSAANTKCAMSASGRFTMDGPARFNNGISAKSIKADTTIVAPDVYEGGTTPEPDR